MIVADDDRVCIAPRANAAAVLEKGRRREAVEEEKRRLYAAGRLGLDINTMRPTLERKGLVYR